MPKAKNKTLPKNFEELISTGDVDAIKSIFDRCDINARERSSQCCALAFNDLPDEIAHWLVEQGADISAVDKYGETPLHARSRHWRGQIDVLLRLGADVNSTDSVGDTPLHNAAVAGHIKNVEILVNAGADAAAKNRNGLTPLGAALQQCDNSRIDRILRISEYLLKVTSRKAGESGLRGLALSFLGRPSEEKPLVTEEMRKFVRRIGTDFEFARERFNPDCLDETSDALDKLYELFGVTPIPRLIKHDGKSLIKATSARWEDRHHELWKLLVPPMGHANNVQGEVIRITGRISIELDGNGGVNWDGDYRKMADAVLMHLGSGNPLPVAELQEAMKNIADIKKGEGNPARLCELAVEWVRLNPEPVALALPAYRR